MKTYILPYVANSMASKALAEGLGVQRLRATGRSPALRSEDFVINWGKSGDGYLIDEEQAMNKPSVLKHITHKGRFFDRMEEVGSDFMVPWTKSAHQVRRWLAEGHKVMARTKLTGHSGQGIVVLSNDDFIPAAHLYTLYIPQHTEYRIHFIRTNKTNVMYKTQEKRLGRDNLQRKHPDEVQNHGNGYIYIINDVDWIPEVEWQRIKDEIDTVFRDVDFGAVDLLRGVNGKYYILEVNAAPGLKSPTLKAFYTDAMTKRIAYEEYIRD